MSRPTVFSGVADAAGDRSVDVAVVGAGVVGLGIAWVVAQSGRTVSIIDEAPASGATFAAAGMLAAVSELHYQEEALLDLTVASAALYPGFLASLGVPDAAAGYSTTPTLVVGADAADRRALADLRAVQTTHGLSVEPLTVREARALEPLLSPQLSCAFLSAQDHQLDPRWLAAELEAALLAWGVAQGWTHAVVLRQNVAALRWSTDAAAASVTARAGVTGVILDDGSTVHAREVIVANGLGAAELGGLPEGLHLPLRAVHGDILRLGVPEHLQPLLTSTVRGLVRGLPVYLVPRADGSLVLGATQREDGSAAVSAGGVHQLLRDAQVLVPAVAELEILEMTARARPGTPDNAPLLGRVRQGSTEHSAEHIPGLIIATGFYRHGVLLTPIAAEICVQLLDGISEPRWNDFLPDRFSPHVARPELEGIPA